MNFGDYELLIGWREALLGAVALLVLYVLVVAFRLRRLRPPVQPASGEVSATDASGDNSLPDSPDGPLPDFASSSVSPYPTIDVSVGERDFPWNEPPEPPGNDERFAAIATELAQVRTELATARSEIAALREEIRQQVERVEAAQHVAPIYGDAMQMALAGHDAATIAQRCGVARAEAELVVALIRNRDNAASGTEGSTAGGATGRIEPTMRDR